jgi:hypothetical protein
MQVNCCLNDAHDSTMTDDRANPPSGGGSLGTLDPLTGGGLRRIGACAENGWNWTVQVILRRRRSEKNSIGEPAESHRESIEQTKKIRARGADSGRYDEWR